MVNTSCAWQVVAGLLEPIPEDRFTAARALKVLDGQEPVRGERGYVERKGGRGPAAQMGGRVQRTSMVTPQPVDALGMPMQVCIGC